MNSQTFNVDPRQPHLNPPRLRSRQASLFYGKFQALRDISLDIPEKAITAIIGPSGCGKSSYLRLFNRMNDLIPDTRVTGRVELDGNSVYEQDVDVVALHGSSMRMTSGPTASTRAMQRRCCWPPESARPD